MFTNLIARLTGRATAAPMVIDGRDIGDIPAHKGFRATTYITSRHGRVQRHVTDHATLERAQIRVITSRREHAINRRLAGWTYSARHTIQNLETGRFCKFMWQVAA
jgi:hypothetical protein